MPPIIVQQLPRDRERMELRPGADGGTARAQARRVSGARSRRAQHLLRLLRADRGVVRQAALTGTTAEDVFAAEVRVALPERTYPKAADVLREAGLVFLYAPKFHPAMRHVGPVRRELGVPTIMNLLGPLVNPAGVSRQVIGVADRARAPLLAAALSRLGAAHALVLHAAVGMDEVSPCGRTGVWEVRDGAVAEWEIQPVRYGLACDDLEGVRNGSYSRTRSAG